MPSKPTASKILSFSILAATLFSVLGCASTPAVAPHSVAVKTESQPAELVATDLSALWKNAWPLIALDASDQAAPGPTLAAGDWLAWQCAYSGGYFDMQPNALAELLESDEMIPAP